MITNVSLLSNFEVLFLEAAGHKSTLEVQKVFIQILVTFEISNLAISVWARDWVRWPQVEPGQESHSSLRARDIDFCLVRLS